MKTTMNFKNKPIKQWFLIDAQEKPLGRVATVVAKMLQGKHKPEYLPHQDMGDYIIIINAEKIALTGNKLFQKKYYKHSGYIGGLKETPIARLLEKNPTKILEKAIWGMLPKNKIRKEFMNKLYIYSGTEHKHEAQKPVSYEISL